MAVQITDIGFTQDTLTAVLSDGRRLSAPLSWFPRLKAAEASQLQDWQICAAGEGVHWPQLDEDVGLAGLPSSEATVHPR